jgi:hypothetical protein
MQMNANFKQGETLRDIPKESNRLSRYRNLMRIT